MNGFSPHHPLIIALTAAVPLWLAELAAMHPDQRAPAVERWRTEGVKMICERGDILQYRGTKKGATAEAFNAMARGIAVLSTMPGGVPLGGVVFCATHHPGGIQTSERMCLQCLAEESARPPEATPAEPTLVTAYLPGAGPHP
jgi:hypothetical protein